MRTIVRVTVLLTLFCLWAPHASFAEDEIIVADGVRYSVSAEAGVSFIVGFEDGLRAATIVPTFMGYPTRSSEEFSYEAPEDLIFAEGVTLMEPYLRLLSSASIRRVKLPSTYQYTGEYKYYDFDLWLYQTTRLETLQLPATISEEDLLYLVEQARFYFDYATYSLHDGYWNGGLYDPLAYRVFSRIEVDPDHPTLYDIDGVLFRKGTDALVACLPGRQGAYVVPQGTKSIESSAFAYCDQLESVTIPRGLTEIGERAFINCAALRTVQLPLTLQRIGSSAFRNCTALFSIVLPEGVKVEESAFYHCVGLRSAYILGVRSVIDESAFYRCHPELVLYARQGTDAYKAAVAGGIYWAEPGGVPQMFPNPKALHTRVAIVDSADENELLPLYEASSETAEVLSRYPVGTTVDVLETDEDWARVRLYQAEGYMPLTRLHLVSDENDVERILEVQVEWKVKLYSAPSLDAPSITMEEWRRYEVVQRVGTWYLLDADGGSWYVRVRDVRPFAMNLGVAEAGVVRDQGASMRANLYREPSTDSECLGYFYNGTQVEILEGYINTGDKYFSRLLVDEKEGYMESNSVGSMADEWFYYAY